VEGRWEVGLIYVDFGRDNNSLYGGDTFKVLRSIEHPVNSALLPPWTDRARHSGTKFWRFKFTLLPVLL